MRSKPSYSLREIAKRDLPLVLSWRNSKRIREISYNDQIISEEDHQRWFEKLQVSKDRLCLVFEVNQQPIGVIQFFEISPETRKCKWGFYLGEENLPKGLGSVMGTLAIDYAFERFEVDQIGGEALSSNPLSQKFHKKLGFIEDGRLERSLFRNDEWIDIYLFSLSRGHWQTKRGKAA